MTTVEPLIGDLWVRRRGTRPGAVVRVVDREGHDLRLLNLATGRHFWTSDVGLRRDYEYLHTARETS